METDKSAPIYIKNLQVLATEMFKVYRNIFPPIVRQLFQPRNNDYNLRQFSQFELLNVRRVFCGKESISFVGSRYWNIVPNEFKKETSLHAFKKLIKKWEPENCPCMLCKSYIENVGFYQDSNFFFNLVLVCMFMAFVIVIYFSILFSLFG